MREFFAQYLGLIVILVAAAIALTIFVFRKRLFDRSPAHKGRPRDPEKIKRENQGEPFRRNY